MKKREKGGNGCYCYYSHAKVVASVICKYACVYRVSCPLLQTAILSIVSFFFSRRLLFFKRKEEKNTHKRKEKLLIFTIIIIIIIEGGGDRMKLEFMTDNRSKKRAITKI